MKERGNFWLRVLDRYIGILLLFFLSIIKPSNKRRQGMQSILVIKIGTIGDTLLLVPVLKAIKDVYPEAFLTVIGSKSNYEVLNRYSFIDSLKIFEVAKVIQEPSYFLRFVKDLNSKEYDVVIDFEPWPRISAILAFFVKTGYKIGFKAKGQFKHFVFDTAVLHSPVKHEIENYISLVGAIDVSVSDRNLEFPIFDAEKALSKYILILPHYHVKNSDKRTWLNMFYARSSSLMR